MPHVNLKPGPPDLIAGKPTGGRAHGSTGGRFVDYEGRVFSLGGRPEPLFRYERRVHALNKALRAIASARMSFSICGISYLG